MFTVISKIASQGISPASELQTVAQDTVLNWRKYSALYKYSTRHLLPILYTSTAQSDRLQSDWFAPPQEQITFPLRGNVSGMSALALPQ